MLPACKDKNKTKKKIKICSVLSDLIFLPMISKANSNGGQANWNRQDVKDFPAKKEELFNKRFQVKTATFST